MKNKVDEAEEQIRAMFAEGKNLSYMARVLSIDLSSISDALVKWGLRTQKSRKRKTAEEKAAVVAAYHSGKTIQQLADENNVTYAAMKENLENWGVGEFRRTGPSRQIELNETFFEAITSPETAYWLGFIFADGSVTYTHETGNVTGVRIDLSRADEPHLLKWKAVVQSGAEVKYRTSTSNGTTYEAAYLDVCCSKMARDLGGFDIVCRKTYIGGNPIPHVPRNLHHHFVRGYFDGDGWISHGRYGQAQEYNAMWGVVLHPDWFNPLKVLIRSHIRHLGDVQAVQSTLTDKTTQLQWSGGAQVRDLLSWMYKGSTEPTRLTRKFVVAQEILPMGL